MRNRERWSAWIRLEKGSGGLGELSVLGFFDCGSQVREPSLRMTNLWVGCELCEFCGLLDGFEDAHVAGAAAEVSGEAFLNLSHRWIGVLREEMVRGEDHARGAYAALRATFFEEALLDGVEVAFGGDAFDRAERCAIGLQSGDEAGVNEFSVEEDGAGSAFAFAAAFFRAGEGKVLAEDVEEALHGRDVYGLWRAVDG